MSEKTKKEMSVKTALLGFFLPLVVLILLIIVGADVAIASLIALFVMAIFCLIMGTKWEDIEAALAEGVHQVAGATIVMLLVGCMVAVWMASGTIPTMLYYGMKIVTPQLYLPVCFLLPAFMSICTGTSWGSLSTIGVVLCGMAAGLGIPVGMAGGAVVSGAFVGDKLSPLSDCTLLGASACEVPLFTHVKSMLYTMIPSFIICLILYIILGFRASGSIDTAAVNALATGLENSFSISIIHIIPIIVVLVLSVKKVPAFITFGIGIAIGVIWSMIFQGHGFIENLNFILSGFHTESGVEAVDTLVNRGGFNSMLSLVGMIIVIGMLSGLFNRSGVLNVLVDGLSRKLKSPKSIIFGAGLSSILMAMAGGQYPAIAIPAVAFKDICDQMNINRAVLARMLADTGVVVSSIIFWNAWTMGYGTVLGGFSTLELIPYNFLAFVSPVVAIIFNFLGIGFFSKDEEVKYHFIWRKKKAN